MVPQAGRKDPVCDLRDGKFKRRRKAARDHRARALLRVKEGQLDRQMRRLARIG